MNIRELILNSLSKNGEIRSSEIIKITGFSRTYVNRFFQQLQDEGKIIRLGQANKSYYIPATKKALQKIRENISSFHRILKNKDLAEDRVLEAIKKNSGIYQNVSENISRIVDYAFTEMLNNAIEHSRSEIIEIFMEKSKQHITFSVHDKGIGIFNNIMEKKHLNNIMEGIQDLLKGKQTTMPDAHSGEGIFFTSRCADMLTIKSSEKKLIYNNLIDDVFIKNIKLVKGTKILFSLALDSAKELKRIFDDYTDDGSFEFSKTEVKVKLHRMGNDYISRSQARRILNGLEKFHTIVLDFQDIDTVGQGFADEIFRVWLTKYSDKKVLSENTNENIDFMIKRVRRFNFRLKQE